MLSYLTQWADSTHLMHRSTSHRWLLGKACQAILPAPRLLVRLVARRVSSVGFLVERGCHVANGYHLITLRLDTALIDDVSRGGVVGEVI